MSQAELDIEAKLGVLFGQNDTLIDLLTTVKGELDAATASSDTAALQALSVKIDAEIGKNAAALAPFQTPATTAPAVAPSPAADVSAPAPAPDASAPTATTTDAGSPPPAVDPAAS